MKQSLLEEFNTEMLGLFTRAGKETGYWPRYYLRDVKKLGGIGAAKKLLDGSKKRDRVWAAR